MTDVMTRLRAETRVEHTAIERTPLAQAMIHGRMTIPQYKGQLAAFRALHAHLEDALDRSQDPDVRAVWRAAEQRKTPAIEHDITTLAEVLEPRSAELAEATARLTAWIDRLEPTELLGALYVVEGSSLGSAILYPRLLEALGLAEDSLTYYRNHGTRSLDVWRAFGARMNETLATDEAKARAIGAAQALFRALRGVFEALAPATEAAPDQGWVPVRAEMQNRSPAQ